MSFRGESLEDIRAFSWCGKGDGDFKADYFSSPPPVFIMIQYNQISSLSFQNLEYEDDKVELIEHVL